MALIATMGAKKDAGFPAENGYISFGDAQGTWTPYTGTYTVGTAFQLRGYGICAGYINVKGHTHITFPDLTSYDFKTIGAYKSDGTCVIVTTGTTSFDCTDYDYISFECGQGGQNITASITVTA